VKSSRGPRPLNTVTSNRIGNTNLPASLRHSACGSSMECRLPRQKQLSRSEGSCEIRGTGPSIFISAESFKSRTGIVGEDNLCSRRDAKRRHAHGRGHTPFRGTDSLTSYLLPLQTHTSEAEGGFSWKDSIPTPVLTVSQDNPDSLEAHRASAKPPTGPGTRLVALDPRRAQLRYIDSSWVEISLSA